MARGRRNGGCARNMRLQTGQTCTLTSTASTTGRSRSMSMATRVVFQRRGAEPPQRVHSMLGKLQRIWRNSQGVVWTGARLDSTDEGPRPAYNRAARQLFLQSPVPLPITDAGAA